MIFTLLNDSIRQRAIDAVERAPDGYQVRIKEAPRNLEQNAALWVLLDAFSRQLQWPVNGVPTSLSAEDWKTVLLAAFEGEMRIAEGLNGGHVFLNLRTSDMTKKRFSEFLDFLHQVAADRGVTV